MLGPALVNVCPIGESLNFLKLSANIPANFLAVSAYASLSAQACDGFKILASTPLSDVGIANLNVAVVSNSEFSIEPSKIASIIARVAFKLILEPTP